MNRDNGDYVYLDDLNDYIDEYDREQDEKRNQKTD